MKLKYVDIVKEILKFGNYNIYGRVGLNLEYDLYEIKIGSGKKILLSAGIHGDEPAGVLAILYFLKNEIKDYTDNFEFHIFPCINPWGFDNNRRGNYNNLNLNREFFDSTLSLENQYLMKSLIGNKYDFTMDFHETLINEEKVGDEPIGIPPKGFYLWEICENKSKRIGDKIVKNISDLGIPICLDDKILEDENSGGVIYYPEGLGSKCYASTSIFDQYLSKYHSSHVFTIESQDEWSMKQRINSHLESLRVVLTNYK